MKDHVLRVTHHILLWLLTLLRNLLYPEGEGIRLLRNTDDRQQGYTIHGLRAMSQFVSGHLLRGSHVRSRANACGICDGQSGAWRGCFSISLFLLCHYLSKSVQ